MIKEWLFLHALAREGRINGCLNLLVDTVTTGFLRINHFRHLSDNLPAVLSATDERHIVSVLH
jgi:hypothetical protein